MGRGGGKFKTASFFLTFTSVKLTQIPKVTLYSNMVYIKIYTNMMLEIMFSAATQADTTHRAPATHSRRDTGIFSAFLIFFLNFKHFLKICFKFFCFKVAKILQPALSPFTFDKAPSSTSTTSRPGRVEHPTGTDQRQPIRIEHPTGPDHLQPIRIEPSSVSDTRWPIRIVVNPETTYFRKKLHFLVIK